MSDAATDPYAVLGVSPEASDGELRSAYRELVKRHHPDHNGGSPESAARFAQVQNAYAVAVERRRSPNAATDHAPGPGVTGFSGSSSGSGSDPNIENRIANLEQELARMRAQEQREATERARQAAARPAAVAAAASAAAASQRADGQARRPTDEELGYYTTDDSFTKIIDDATEKLAERVRESDGKRQFTQRLADLFGRGSR
jgi:curved DNA-binding protein CbpA